MSLFKKAFWPAALAIAMLVALGAVGPGGGVKTADAVGFGRLCAIDGPQTMSVGANVLYRVRSDNTGGITLYTADVDNLDGDVDITSVAQIFNINAVFGGLGGIHVVIAPTNTIGNLQIAPIYFWDPRFLAAEDAAGNFTTNQNSCGATTAAAVALLINSGIAAGEVCVNTGTTTAAAPGDGFAVPAVQPANPPQLATTGNSAVPVPPLCFSSQDQFGLDNSLQGQGDLFGDNDIDCTGASTCVIAAAVVTAAANSVAADINAGLVRRTDCGTIATNATNAAVQAGGQVGVAAQIGDYILVNCLLGFPGWAIVDGVGYLDITCNRGGQFELTVTSALDATDSLSITVNCIGPASAANSRLTATPASVEIIPAPGNVSHSLIIADLKDANGAAAGWRVDFRVDSTSGCTIETSSLEISPVPAGSTAGVQDLVKQMAAEALFSGLNASVPSTAAAIESSVYATTAPDGSATTDATTAALRASGGVITASRAEAILHCDLAHAPGAKPGQAVVTAIIDLPFIGCAPGPTCGSNSDDVVLTTNITVVGPPTAVTAVAAPTSLRCGEKSTITVTVKDAAGQNVSDHTRVEAVTNYGGVLGGTGAVVGLAGPVVPLSSTVAETFGGQATFYLLTSEATSGPYEVVVTTGGSGALTGTPAGGSLGGLFSTAPISTQVTVTCTIPSAAAPAAPAPAQPTPPRTGTGGIVPPNTGDAGLVAAQSSNSWLLFVAAGLVAFALAGVATVKAARR